MTGRADDRGRLIAFEGIDGCGKSTQARLAAERLDALYTFEPGDTELGASLRRLVLDSDGVLSPRAEALLLAADRAQHVDQVLTPALEAGRWVVTDRFNGSTLAYQGAGRGLDADSLDRVLSFATGGLAADLSILIDVPTNVAQGRSGSAQPDRLERLDANFHRRVAEGYRLLAARDPGRWAVVDGTGSIEEVASEVAAVVGRHLGRPEAPA